MTISLSWSLDGRSSFIAPFGRSYIIPQPLGEILKRIPAGGFHSDEELARLPGARRIDAPSLVPGPSADVYAFLSRHDAAQSVPHPDSVKLGGGISLGGAANPGFHP
jgi:hypothetical protein